MKVTVTGAAGRIGAAVCRELARAGHAVRAVDKVVRRDLPVPVEPVELLNREACYAVLDGAEAVVHVADGATLVAAVLRTAYPPGLRTYLPSAVGSGLGRPVAEVLQERFAGVPLRRAVSGITRLVDISRITEETGWLPEYDEPAPAGARQETT